jgi:hypothetical protein
VGIISGGGGGAAQPFVGARVSLGNSNFVPYDGSAIPWDYVGYDTSGFYNPVSYKFVIPAGKTGLYSVTGLIYVKADASITGAIFFVETPGDPDPALTSGIDFVATKWVGNGNWMVPFACDTYAHVGDTIHVDGSVFGDSPELIGNSYVSLIYRGSPTYTGT